MFFLLSFFSLYAVISLSPQPISDPFLSAFNDYSIGYFDKSEQPDDSIPRYFMPGAWYFDRTTKEIPQSDNKNSDSNSRITQPSRTPVQFAQTGLASWYDYQFRGIEVTKHKFVAASRDYPRGTRLRVRGTGNERTVTVTVTDYGPDKKVHPDRIIDLGSKAFKELAPLSQGVIEVTVEEVK